MFDSNIASHDQGAGDDTFVLIENNGRRTRRLLNSRSLSSPLTLTIDHSTIGKGADIRDRHFIQLADTVTGDVSGITYNDVVTLTVTVSRKNPADSTQTNPYQLAGMLINFLNNSDAAQALTNLGRVMKGES